MVSLINFSLKLGKLATTEWLTKNLCAEWLVLSDDSLPSGAFGCGKEPVQTRGQKAAHVDSGAH
jgi:hypothetical protein